jgi:hypothetical protein
MNTDLIVYYRFSRDNVVRSDLSRFLSLYAPDRLPAGRRLRAMMNSMVFCIEGYDDDPREIHCIPEVRRFYSAFHEAWPWWLYFCNLDNDVLKITVACCMHTLGTMKQDGQPDISVAFNPIELLGFLKKDFGPLNDMCERAQIFERLVCERTRRLFEYFGLPFDGQPEPRVSPKQSPPLVGG